MRDEQSPKDFCGEVTCRQVGRDKEVETITEIMTAAKLFLLSCLVAVVGYFTYRELQVSTLGLVKKIHIPASGLMCSRNCSTILNFTLKSIHYGTYFHNREVSFDIFRVLVPSSFQKPRFRCEFDRRTKFQ